MRLLLIEDNLKLAGLIREGVEQAGHQLDSVHSRKTAEHSARRFDYALWILDLGLPDGDGLALLRQLRRQGLTQPCLVLTARDALHDRVDGLDAGADDYVTKPFAMAELVARIHALLRRPRILLNELVFANLRYDPRTHSLAVDGQAVELPPGELLALECLLRAKDHRCRRQHIEDCVYGMNVAVTPNALEVLLHRLRRRLHDAGAQVTIKALRGHGYVLACI